MIIQSRFYFNLNLVSEFRTIRIHSPLEIIIILFLNESGLKLLNDNDDCEAIICYKYIYYKFN